MKRNLLALAVGAAILLPLTAQAAPTVYGRLNLSVDYVDVDSKGTEPVWTLNSNASRIGVKGNEKLSDDFTAVYKAEWQVNGDMAAAGDLSGRERYIGLKHSSLGTLRLGAIDSPLKTSEDMVDVFNDSILDMQNLVTGQTRLNNSINYVSPKILDVFGANITIQPGETQTSNDLGNAYSAAFSYEDDNLYLSVAMDKGVASSIQFNGTQLAELNVELVKAFLGPVVAADFGAEATLVGNTLTTNRDTIRLVGRYKMDKLVLAGLYQEGEAASTTANATPVDEQTFLVSGSYEMDKLTFRGEIGKSNFDFDGEELDVTLIGIGIDYNFTQNTKVFGNLASKTEELGGVFSTSDVTTMVLGGGVEVRF